MERAVALERTPSILPESLPETPPRHSPGRHVAAPTSAPPPAPTAGGLLVHPARKGFDLEQHVQHLEREYIAEALRRSTV